MSSVRSLIGGNNTDLVTYDFSSPTKDLEDYASMKIGYACPVSGLIPNPKI